MVVATERPASMPETPTFIHIVHQYQSDSGAAMIESRPYSVLRNREDVSGLVLQERWEAARSVEEGMLLTERYIAEACGLDTVECEWYPYIGENSFETWMSLGNGGDAGFPHSVLFDVEPSNDAYLARFLECAWGAANVNARGAFLTLDEAQIWCTNIAAAYLGLHSVGLRWHEEPAQDGSNSAKWFAAVRLRYPLGIN
jgi:hypothetical protein